MADLGPVRSLEDEITLSRELLPGWTRAFVLRADGRVDVTLTGPANLSGMMESENWRSPNVVSVSDYDAPERILRNALERALSQKSSVTTVTAAHPARPYVVLTEHGDTT